jgi:hypothetical protein
MALKRLALNLELVVAENQQGLLCLPVARLPLMDRQVPQCQQREMSQQKHPQ